jgi:predicted HicB family RNase H-like nuclease
MSEFTDVTPVTEVSPPEQVHENESLQTAPPQLEACRIAGEMFRHSPDWVTFFREILGVDGVVRRLFPDTHEMAEFEKTEEYEKIQRMLARLRVKQAAGSGGAEPTRVITVRLPASLHKSLQTEAYDRETSMNKLCISKLLQVIDGGLIPSGEKKEKIEA